MITLCPCGDQPDCPTCCGTSVLIDGRSSLNAAPVIKEADEAQAQKDLKLWRRWKAGDNQALSSLFDQFQPTMDYWFNRVSSNDLPDPVLKGEIEHQVLKAFDSYKPNKGAKLNTWVNARLPKVYRLIYKTTNIGRIPEERQRMVGSYLTAKDELQKKLGRPPSVQELQDELKGMSVKDITALEKEVRDDLLLNEDFENMSFDGKTIEREAMDWVYPSLRGREKLVFERLTGYGGKAKKKQKDIAMELGVSPATVVNIKRKIADKIEEASFVLGR